MYLTYLALVLTATLAPILAPTISPITAGTANIGISEPEIKYGTIAAVSPILIITALVVVATFSGASIIKLIVGPIAHPAPKPKVPEMKPTPQQIKKASGACFSLYSTTLSRDFS